MKRTLFILTLVLALGIGTMVVFADSGKVEAGFPGWQHENMTEQERTEWFNERNEYRNEYRNESLKKELADGKITEAEAKEWEEHFKYEDDFHDKNGYIGRGCHSGNGMMRGNGGMMRGNRF
jgi:hypothetical protein